MATIGEFNGIRIAVHYEGGQPHSKPHFHGHYAGIDVSIEIETLEILAKSKGFPAAVLTRIRKWAKDNRELIKKAWNEINGL